MTASTDPHIQALRDALVAEHEDTITRFQTWADEAAAQGKDWHHRWYQRQVDTLKATPYPWDNDDVA
jgi:hypothetical protein